MFTLSARKTFPLSSEIRKLSSWSRHIGQIVKKKIWGDRRLLFQSSNSKRFKKLSLLPVCNAIAIDKSNIWRINKIPTLLTAIKYGLTLWLTLRLSDFAGERILAKFSLKKFVKLILHWIIFQEKIRIFDYMMLGKMSFYAEKFVWCLLVERIDNGTL